MKPAIRRTMSIRAELVSWQASSLVGVRAHLRQLMEDGTSVREKSKPQKESWLRFGIVIKQEHKLELEGTITSQPLFSLSQSSFWRAPAE